MENERVVRCDMKIFCLSRNSKLEQDNTHNQRAHGATIMNKLKTCSKSAFSQFSSNIEFFILNGILYENF